MREVLLAHSPLLLLHSPLCVIAGACLTFAREGYKFWDFSLRDVADSMMNVGFLKFALVSST